MSQEDKELLLKDLCARLPYGVIIQGLDNVEPLTIKNLAINMAMSDNLYLPYLRTISSMTKEEMREYQAFFNYDGVEYPEEYIDWLNEHHFDYRGLIEKGLALEAPEGMYKFDK